MPTSGPGSRRRRAAAFTLLELLVVVAIIAVASAGVAFALRDNAQAPLERDAQRLAALLESARAKSRLTGRPVRWSATESGFAFEGLPPASLPTGWLSDATHVVGSTTLVLGPDPLIPPQAVELANAKDTGHSLRVATDGLRPFAVTVP